MPLAPGHEGFAGVDPQKRPSHPTLNLKEFQFEVTPAARLAPDGTRWCAFTDTTVDYRGDDAACPACKTTLGSPTYRKRKSRADQQRREALAQRNHIVLPIQYAKDLSETLQALTAAIGDASSNFQETHRDTWQHRLLLAAKEAHVVTTPLHQKVEEWERVRAEIDTPPGT